jgi:hypothetical protein
MTSFPGRIAKASRRTLISLAAAAFVAAGLAGVIAWQHTTTHSPAQVQATDEPPGSGVDPRFPSKPDNPSVM